MNGIISIVLVVVCFNLVSTQKISFGQCQNVQVQQDFRADRFTGLWYEIEKYTVPFEIGLKCVTANYTQESDHLKVVNAGIFKWINMRTSLEAQLNTPNSQEPAKMQLTASFLPGIFAPFWVLDTNYDEYSVIYSCVDVIVAKAEYLWILSRNPTLNDSTKNGIYERLEEKGLDTTPFNPTEQDC